MSRLHVNHLKVTIQKFKDKIDISDMIGKPQLDIDKIILSRGFAAYSLHILSSVDIDVATKAIVDGFDDNGIDAILFDRSQKILWLVQSKWLENGVGEPENGDIVKFTNGIRDLIDLTLDRFNDKIKSKEPEIVDALNDPMVKIKIVLASFVIG